MLLLFPFEDKKEKVRLFSHYELVGAKLQISYVIEDNENELEDFYPLESGKEMFGSLFPLENLWTTTCFEIFLKNFKGDDYYEFNFNSKGEWNVFYFSGYRQRVKEHKVDLEIKMLSRSTNERHQLQFQFDIKKLTNLKLPCQVSLATVVKTHLGVSYWSQKHNGQKADFHDPKNFSVILNSSEGKK